MRTQVLALAGISLWLAARLPAAPSIHAGGVVNAADYTASFSPGILFSVFGSSLAPATRAASNVPLPRSLDGVSVEITDGSRVTNAPLVFVSPGQINAQLPFQIGSDSVGVRVRAAGGTSNTVEIPVSARRPRLLTQSLDGKGPAILVHSNYSLVSSAQPAAPSEVVLLFLTGLGAVTPAIAEGAPGGDGSDGHPLNRVSETVAVLVNGLPAPVHFPGLAPGFPGLYQINFEMPAGLRGGAASIVVSVGGQQSQRDVTAICAMAAWQPLMAMETGPTGATLDGGGFSLRIPAGGFDERREVRLLRAASAGPAPARVASETFGISGLPATIHEPLTVEIAAATPPEPDTTYVVIEEPGERGGTVFLKATVDGNRIRATLPPRRAATPPNRLAAATDEPGEAILLYALTGIAQRKGRMEGFGTEFEVLAEQSVDSRLAEEVYNGISAYMPLLISYELLAIPQSLTVFVGSYPGARLREPWGETVQSSWTEDAAIKMNSEYGRTKGTNEFVAKFAHLLFELAAVSRGVRSTWLWMDEAAATFYETVVANPAVPASNEEVSTALQGLAYPGADAAGARRHGRGGHLFLEHINTDSGFDSMRFLGELYREKAAGAALPLRVLERRGVNLTQQWLSFCERLPARNAAVFDDATELFFGDPSQGAKSRLLVAQDLSLHGIRLRFGSRPSGPLRASVTGNSNTNLFLFRVGKTIQKLAGPAKQLEYVNAAGVEAAGDRLLLLVVNAQAREPYDTLTPTLVEVRILRATPLDELRRAQWAQASLSGVKFVCSEQRYFSCPTSLRFDSNAADVKVPLTPTSSGFTGTLAQGSVTTQNQYAITLSAEFAPSGTVVSSFALRYAARFGAAETTFTFTFRNLARSSNQIGATTITNWFDLTGPEVRSHTFDVTYESKSGSQRTVVSGIDWEAPDKSPRIGLMIVSPR